MHSPPKTPSAPKVIVTGGAGYIGSHVCKELWKQGYLPVVFDNLSHGHRWAVKWGPLYEGSLQNLQELDALFSEIKPIAVIHLAGSIHLRESIENPYKHYVNNVVASLSLFDAMVRHNIPSLVFSSSAAIYDTPSDLTSSLDEEATKAPLSPYGKTKWMTEQILQDFYMGYGLSSVSLRYFNAAGADLEGELGEAHDPETHLIPRALFVAQKKEPHLTIYHSDHPTKDGTALRDYIHVSDLAKAHVCALEWLQKHPSSCEAFNLGTGLGHSVLDIVKTVEEITKEIVSLRFEHREKNTEHPRLVANAAKARSLLQWTPSCSTLHQIISSAWKWHLYPCQGLSCSSSSPSASRS